LRKLTTPITLPISLLAYYPKPRFVHPCNLAAGTGTLGERRWPLKPTTEGIEMSSTREDLALLADLLLRVNEQVRERSNVATEQESLLMIRQMADDLVQKAMESDEAPAIAADLLNIAENLWQIPYEECRDHLSQLTTNLKLN
jgi:hypothetical protein